MEDWELRNNSYITHAIACSAVANLQAQGAKNPKLEWFDPVSRLMQRKRSRKDISLRAARTFMDLSNQGKIPGWVFSVVDIDAIELASD